MHLHSRRVSFSAGQLTSLQVIRSMRPRAGFSGEARAKRDQANCQCFRPLKLAPERRANAGVSATSHLRFEARPSGDLAGDQRKHDGRSSVCACRLHRTRRNSRRGQAAASIRLDSNWPWRTNALNSIGRLSEADRTALVATAVVVIMANEPKSRDPAIAWCQAGSKEG